MTNLHKQPSKTTALSGEGGGRPKMYIFSQQLLINTLLNKETNVFKREMNHFFLNVIGVGGGEGGEEIQKIEINNFVLLL